MRKPHIRYEKGEKSEQKSNPEGSGTLARVKRFLSLSLGGGRLSPPSLERTCAKSCVAHLSSTSTSTILTKLKSEAERVFGRPIDELKLVSDHGVPAFVHALCCYIRTHGVDYETLISMEWEGEDIKSSIEEGVLRLSYESLTDDTVAAALLRLFLHELPHPLLNKETVFSLMRIRKEIDAVDDVRSEQLNKIRNVLIKKVTLSNHNLLRYLTHFLHQLQVANKATCPVSTTQLGLVLACTFSEIGMKDSLGISSSQVVAEMLLLNEAAIFREGIRPLLTDYSSDSVSSACDSRGEETGDDDTYCHSYDGRLLSGGEVSATDDIEDDSTTTTTTDTDDFRSPLVSPLNKPFLSRSAKPPLPVYEVRPLKRFPSTAEVSDIDNCHTKLVPYGKKYISSITGFVTSAGESWADEKLRRDVDKFDSLVGAQSTESSCISGGDVSDENDGDRDADGSETEGSVIPCPHDERRFSERFYPLNYNSSTRRPKRKTRRKHSKDNKNRILSSEEDDRSEHTLGLLSFHSNETEDSTHSNLEQNTALRDLVESSDPVQSDRSSWCLRRDEQSLSDNCWQRTSRHFSREDYNQSIQPNNWYRTGDHEDSNIPSSSKYCDQLSTGPSYDFSSSPGGGGDSQTVIKNLSKHVSSLKRKVKKLEEEFEISFGYRPSHSDKMKCPQIKKQMTELSKSKKELKKLKDEMPDKKTKSYPMSLLRCQESTSQISSSSLQSSDSSIDASETLRQMEERLTSKRSDANRPIELTLLSLEQYMDEKIDLQNDLLYYESIHGRPVTREDKDRVRPLYDRYRQVKRGIARLSSRSKESIELAPILEHEAMDFTLASPQHRGNAQDDTKQELGHTEETQEEIKLPIRSEVVTLQEVNLPATVSASTLDINLGDLHALPIHELKDRKREAKDQKKKIRKNLREFEDKFERENGRKMQKEERGPMEQAYTQYKHVKAKLRLLEALLSKHDSR